MQATLKWIDGMIFLGESGSGHTVVMDGAPEHGGRNMGFRPMEMLLIGARGCSSFDVVQILQKGRHDLEKWIMQNTPFDRLYFYGDKRPIHVSYSPEPKGECVDMIENKAGRQMPKVRKR